MFAVDNMIVLNGAEGVTGTAGEVMKVGLGVMPLVQLFAFREVHLRTSDVSSMLQRGAHNADTHMSITTHTNTYLPEAAHAASVMNVLALTGSCAR